MSTRASETGNYTVLARRYRPQQFDECIGQEHVARSLRNAIEAERVAHAYLFTGARGVGKTSMARIFAKAMNCREGGPTPNPCGVCDSCQSVANGEDVDVIEIDGASNRGIDEVRELRQGVGYRPSRGPFKIYIIDEVHMLTKEAFNALLKTLEEPPPHVKFVFATTEPQKVPVTILSRCQRFDFASIETARIIDRLRQIATAENAHVDAEALEVIARRAGGSMRDSQSLFDQVLAFAPEHLTASDVHRVLGTAGDEQIHDAASAILAGDGKTCLELVQQAVSGGIQLGEWVQQLLEYFRDLLVIGVSPQAELVSVPSRLRETLQEQAKNVSPERILEMMDLLAGCRARMRGTTYTRTLLEMTLVRLCRLDAFLDLSQVTAAPPSGVQRPVRPAEKPASMPAVHRSASPATRVTPVEVAEAPPVLLTADSVQQIWQTVAEQCDDVTKGMCSQVSRIEYVPPGRLEVHLQSPLAKKHCEEPARLESLTQKLTALTGKALRLELHVAESGDAKPNRRGPSELQLRETARQNPIVQRAQEVLSARLVGRVQSSMTENPESEPAEGQNE